MQITLIFKFSHDTAEMPTMHVSVPETGVKDMDASTNPSLWLQFSHLRDLAKDGQYVVKMDVQEDDTESGLDFSRIVSAKALPSRKFYSKAATV